MSLQRCKDETTSTELPLWMAYLDMLEESHTKQDYYLANIAATVIRSVVSTADQKKVKLEDYLLTFKRDVPKPPITQLEPLEDEEEDDGTIGQIIVRRDPNLTPEEAEARVQASKAAWGDFLSQRGTHGRPSDGAGNTPGAPDG
jgi:hypothetical protein